MPHKGDARDHLVFATGRISNEWIADDDQAARRSEHRTSKSDPTSE